MTTSDVSNERWTAPMRGRAIGARLVAMFDVLGFRNMVRDRGLLAVLGDYDAMLFAAETSRMTEVQVSSNGRPTGLVRWRAPHAVFSDTLIFWCNDDSDCIWNFLKMCGAIAGESLQRGMPLRGGIAFGEALLDKEAGIYLGQPIVDAYLAESNQDWVGVALHGSCFDDPAVAAVIRSHEDVVACAVPTKCADPSLEHALLWHQYIMGAPDVLAALANRAPSTAKSKYDNAINFVREHALR